MHVFILAQCPVVEGSRPDLAYFQVKGFNLSGSVGFQLLYDYLQAVFCR